MHQRTYQSTSEGLIDTTLLSDDHPKLIDKAGPGDDGWWVEAQYMNGRWAHVLDSHLSEMSEYERYTDLPEKNWCHIKGSKSMRENRFMRLSWYLEGLRVHIKRRKKTGRDVKLLQAKVHTAVKGIKRRYQDSIDAIVARGATEWYLLYLTKEQKNDLINLARDAYLGR